MIGAFQFENEGRKYSCTVEGPKATRKEAWWWFSVTGDQQRYAPFQAVAGDTQASVRARIINYYTELLARRAMPYQPRHQWAGRPKSAAPAPK